MADSFQVGGVVVDVLKKDIKNVHLSVYPPNGRVRISAPLRMDLETIRLFAVTKLGWIKQQQKKITDQERETPREYLERESHYVWGRRYLLRLVESDGAPRVELNHRRLEMFVPAGADERRKQEILDEWYRRELKRAAIPVIAKWERLMGVKAQRFFVQRMKTKWGSCNAVRGTIRLNSELAKKPAECLEYVVVHELAHLLEPTHNERFTAAMDLFMPNWRVFRDRLNRLPVRHDRWE